MNTTIEISPGSRILLPTGRDDAECVQAFEEQFGIEVPAFGARSLTASRGERTFVKVKGKDVPEYIAQGHGDFGLTGTDVCEEQILKNANVLYRPIGKRMCTFELLFPADQADDLSVRLCTERAEPITVATSFPNFLGKCIKRAQEGGSRFNITVSSFKPSGSVEASPALGMSDAVADLVGSGETAEKNNLKRQLKLADVFPAIVWRDPAKSPAPLRPVTSYDGIAVIDAILAKRRSQINDLSVNSYTLERLRDPNRAIKKYGEEGAEYLAAIVGGESLRDCEEELADLIYGGLIAGNAKERQVSLGGVVRILASRNKDSSLQRQGGGQ